MRIENIDERHFYEVEAVKNNWSLRELNRQFDAALYERLALSIDKEKISQLAKEGQLVEKTSDIVKDPYVLEFLGLEEKSGYSESDLETHLIDNLQKFLLELEQDMLLLQGRRDLHSVKIISGLTWCFIIVYCAVLSFLTLK